MQAGFVLLVAGYKGHLGQAIVHALVQRKGDIIHSSDTSIFQNEQYRAQLSLLKFC